MMSKKTILWTISLVILGIATAYGALYYLQWRDKQLWEKQNQEKQEAEQEKLNKESATENMPNLLDLQKESGTESQKTIPIPDLNKIAPTENQNETVVPIPNLNK